jgi:3-oxoacyl-[acyl-carrier protein] reductase
MFDMSGKTAVVTGGTRGIGRAVTALLYGAGARVMAGYHSDEQAAASIEADYPGVLTMAGDLACPEAARRLIDGAFSEFGKVDILINNAGIWQQLRAGSGDLEAWDRTMDANLRSVYILTDYLVSRWRDHGEPGTVVNVSSTAGQRGEACYAHYAASKGAIIAYTKSLGAELAPYGIRVNAVAPGWVATDMTAGVMEGEGRRQIATGIPLGRVPEAEEIAWPILFLASDRASAIVGEILNVNGGGVLCG